MIARNFMKTKAKLALLGLTALCLPQIYADSMPINETHLQYVSQATENREDPEAGEQAPTQENSETTTTDRTALIQELNDRLNSLQDELDSLIAKDDDIQAEILEVANLPTEEFLADSNLLLKGIIEAHYVSQHHANETFQVNFAPRILWRLGDRFLTELFFLYSSGFGGSFKILDATTSWVINDYVTLRAGIFEPSLGFYFYRSTGGNWVKKIPSSPFPYTGFPLLIPIEMVGVSLRGAFPLTCCGWESCIAPVITYDLWVGNGPKEFFGDIDFISGFAFGGSLDDNNHEKTVGGRLGLRLQPNFEIGASGAWGRWNSNALPPLIVLAPPPPPVDPSHTLNYAALVLDWNFLFCHKYRIVGEYIWTRRDAFPNPFVGILRDVIYERGAWVQLSAMLTDFVFFDCCEWPDYMDDFEVAFRYSMVDSDKLIIQRKEMWSFGLSYYWDPTFILRTSYDINRGFNNKNNVFTVNLVKAF